MINQVEQRWAQLVLGWVTAWSGLLSPPRQKLNWWFYQNIQDEVGKNLISRHSLTQMFCLLLKVHHETFTKTEIDLMVSIKIIKINPDNFRLDFLSFTSSCHLSHCARARHWCLGGDGYVIRQHLVGLVSSDRWRVFLFTHVQVHFPPLSPVILGSGASLKCPVHILAIRRTTVEDQKFHDIPRFAYNVAGNYVVSVIKVPPICRLQWCRSKSFL